MPLCTCSLMGLRKAHLLSGLSVFYLIAFQQKKESTYIFMQTMH